MRRALVPGVMLLLGAPCWAQDGKIIAQQRNAAGEGYTVMRVWGGHHDMGYAQGFMLAADVEQAAAEVKSLAGAMYGQLRTAMQATVWKPTELGPVSSAAAASGPVSSAAAASGPVQTASKKLKLLPPIRISSWLCRVHSRTGRPLTHTGRKPALWIRR